jgi:hypothetical protein
VLRHRTPSLVPGWERFLLFFMGPAQISELGPDRPIHDSPCTHCGFGLETHTVVRTGQHSYLECPH